MRRYKSNEVVSSIIVGLEMEKKLALPDGAWLASVWRLC